MTEMEKMADIDEMMYGCDAGILHTGDESLRMAKYLQVFTTTDKPEDAERIANTLVENRLAGCVQIVGPVVSTYWWRGNMETTEEWLCLIKTRQDLYSRLEIALKQIHPYETPEIVAVPITAGSKENLDWLTDELASE